MGRTKGSKNKSKILRGTPHKHLIDDKDEKTISKESNSMPLRESIPEIGTKRMPDVSQQAHEGMEKNASTDQDSANEDELQSVHARLREAGASSEASLREMRGHVQPGTPSRLHEAIGSNVVVQKMSHAQSQVHKTSDLVLDTCETCKHHKSIHYGSKYHQCNTRGCLCDGFNR